MSELAEIQPQQLTAVERSRNALRFEERKAELAELAKKSGDITVITNQDGRHQVHSARMRLKAARVGIEHDGKAARADAQEFSKAVIAGEKELIALIEPEEHRLQRLQDDWDAEIEREKAARAEVEQARIRKHRANIQTIRDYPLSLGASDSTAIAEAIAEVEAMNLAGSFAEFQTEADDARAGCLDRLRKLYDGAVHRETEARRIAAERAELEAARAAQVERDRIAAERRAEADRAAAAERAAQAAAQKAIDDAAALERRKAEEAARAQREAEESAARAERQRLEAIEREKQAAALKAEADRIEALRLERAEADRIERERQKAEADRLAEESRLLAEQRAEIARKEAAELAEREEREIAAATLREAAREAVGLLCDSGQAHHIITRKLSAALHRELLP